MFRARLHALAHQERQNWQKNEKPKHRQHCAQAQRVSLSTKNVGRRRTQTCAADAALRCLGAYNRHQDENDRREKHNMKRRRLDKWR